MCPLRRRETGPPGSTATPPVEEGQGSLACDPGRASLRDRGGPSPDARPLRRPHRGTRVPRRRRQDSRGESSSRGPPDVPTSAYVSGDAPRPSSSGDPSPRVTPGFARTLGSSSGGRDPEPHEGGPRRVRRSETARHTSGARRGGPRDPSVPRREVGFGRDVSPESQVETTPADRAHPGPVRSIVRDQHPPTFTGCGERPEAGPRPSPGY